MSMSINFFSVAKLAELLRSPQRRSGVTVQNQEMIVEKEMLGHRELKWPYYEWLVGRFVYLVRRGEGRRAELM